MQDSSEPSPKQRLGRRIALVILLSCMVIMVLFLIAAPFLQRLMHQDLSQSLRTTNPAGIGLVESARVPCTQSAQNS